MGAATDRITMEAMEVRIDLNQSFKRNKWNSSQGGGYGSRNGGGRWNNMSHDNNGWNNSWNNDSYSDNSQWNSPWDNGQSQGWGNGGYNQNWANDSFGTGYQQNYSGGSQRGYSGNNRMVPYSNQS